MAYFQTAARTSKLSRAVNKYNMTYSHLPASNLFHSSRFEASCMPQLSSFMV